jgi:hypothetical protein
MKVSIAMLTFVAPLFVAHGHVASAANPATPEGLIKISSKNFDSVYVHPGADLRAYSKVMIEPAMVEFRGEWIRDMNNARETSQRIGSKEAQEIAKDARSWMDDALNETFAGNHYKVVRVAEPNTLRLSPKIADLYVNAPDRLSPGRRAVLTNDAGAATLTLEARDALTNVLIIAMSDRRTAARIGGLTPASDVSNRSDFSRMFTQWATSCLTEIKTTTLPASR